MDWTLEVASLPVDLVSPLVYSKTFNKIYSKIHIRRRRPVDALWLYGKYLNRIFCRQCKSSYLKIFSSYQLPWSRYMKFGFGILEPFGFGILSQFVVFEIWIWDFENWSLDLIFLNSDFGFGPVWKLHFGFQAFEIRIGDFRTPPTYTPLYIVIILNLWGGCWFSCLSDGLWWHGSI